MRAHRRLEPRVRWGLIADCQFGASFPVPQRARGGAGEGRGAGGLGGGIGGMFGQMGGFAGGIAATAALQQITNAINGVKAFGEGIKNVETFKAI